MKEETHMKKILFAVLAMVPVLCGCSMKKAYKKAASPDMDITEDDTTGNPVKEPEIPGNRASWTVLMYVAPTLNSEDRYAKWSKNASMLQLLAYIYKDNWMHPENTIE